MHPSTRTGPPAKRCYSSPSPRVSPDGTVNMSKEIIDLQRFAAEFLSLARRKVTGTYRVACADGKEKDLLVHEGLIVDIDLREETPLLTSAILATGRISERQLKKARKELSRTGESFGAILLAQ